ncbi:hypothetical protein ACKKBF_B40440 [Auxenochlorella protothecoides x Auxenochlorella symbiontica]
MLSQLAILLPALQPSMDIFEAFDALLLLQRGGRLTYLGDLGFESSQLVAYLEAQPGVEPIRPGYNPATWMLEVTGGSMSTTFKDAGQDFPTLYRVSHLFQQNEAHASQLLERCAKEHPPLTLRSKHAASQATQRRWLIRKFCKMYWHLPQYNMTRIFLTTIISFIYGALYYNQGNVAADGSISAAQVQNIAGVLFSMTTFLGLFNCISIIPLLSAERTVFYRERAAAMYSPGPYTLATSVAEIPYLLIQALIMSVVAYWMVGFDPVAWKFFYFLLLLTLVLTMYTLLGQFLIYLTPNQLMAMMLASLFNQLWNLSNGFMIPYSELPRGWKWLNRISPATWSLYGLACSQLCDKETLMTGFSGSDIYLPDFMRAYFGWDFAMIWWCVLIVFAYCIFFRTASVILLSKVSYLRR